MKGSFVLASGGTGGHLFAAEALSVELLGAGNKVHLITDSRAEAFPFQVPNIETHQVRTGQFGRGPARAAHALGDLALGVLQARRLLRRLAPVCVVGFGGYPSVPTMLAAVSLGLPTVIHEQNAVLGRANRLLAPRVRRIATSFPLTAGLRSADRAKAVHTGNPVRRSVLAVTDAKYKPPQRGGEIELLILGGSQGARIMSKVVPPALAALPSRFREMLRITHQARPEDLLDAEAIYRRNRICADLQSFFEDVPERLARAQLTICRAGASTIAELAAVGRPAVLIPYPHATDDHQAVNARAFAEAGGGWIITQHELRADTLALHLEKLLGDATALREAARRASEFGRRDAPSRLAQLAVDIGIDRRPQGCAA